MTTNSQIRDPFVGRPSSGSFEIPTADVHEGRIVGLIDLGTHLEVFKDSKTETPRHKVFLAFELDQQMAGSEHNFVVGETFTLSFHAKASLRQLAEALLNDGASFSAAAEKDVDYKALLGQPCTVEIKHVKSSDGAKTFFK